MQGYPGYGQPTAGVPTNAPESQQADAQQAPAGPEKANVCPECGARLDDNDDRYRYKHAVYHWGPDPLPNYPSTLEARKRYAAVLGVEIGQVTS